VRWSVGVME